MSAWTPIDGIDDEEEEEDDLIPKFNGREGTIYLIDAEKSITADPDAFCLCLRCIEADLLKGITANARDLVAVVFYNTANSPSPTVVTAMDPDLSIVVPSNCAIFMPLKPLSKDSIRYFKNFRESKDFFDFENVYGTSSSGINSFSEALWLCSRLIMRCNYKLINSKIVLFTNDEQPHMPGTSELQQTFVRARDLFDNNISIDLVPMVDEFDMEPFYKEFLLAVSGGEEEELQYKSPEDQRNDLLNRVFKQTFRKNCLRHLNLWLTSDGLSIGCDIHSLTKTAKKPPSIKMFRDNNELIVSKVCQMAEEFDEETGSYAYTRKVLPGELFKCQEICGKEIIFSSEEMTTIQTLISPGLRLLGFKPLTELPARCFVKHVCFLYPSDANIKGSTKLFRALWEKCLEKEKFVLCTLTYRRKAAPRYVALIPQTQELDGNDGFRIIYLPMETDWSHLDVMDIAPPPITEANIDILKKICKKLRFKYVPEMFSNPNLETFYSTIEALVYDEVGNEMEDTTLPNADNQDDKIGDFLDLVDLEFGKEQATAKRSNSDGGAGVSSRSKAPKKDLTTADIEQAIRNGRMEMVTVQNLKDFIRTKGGQLPSNAVKKNLFEVAQNLVG